MAARGLLRIIRETRFKAVLLGAALAALLSARPALAQESCGEYEECPPPPPSQCPTQCIECDYEVALPPCEEVTFSPGEPTQKFDFGTGHFIKITANVVRPFTLAVQFIPITQAELTARLNAGLGPANCIPYDGATSNTALGSCGFYHVVEPLPIQGDAGCTDCDYSGDVLYDVFWDFPTLDQLNNIRLYRAPIPVDNDPAPNCAGGIGFDGGFCFTQDLTDTVFPLGATGNADPGISGKGKSFSDYEVVDRTGNDLTAKVRIGLKWFWDAGIRFDLKAVVKRNGVEVSSGELLGSPGGGVLFQNAKLRTIPLSFLPPQTFAGGDNISIKVLVRNSCLGSPQLTGVARLWYDDNSMSQVTVAGVPTLFLVRGDDNEREDWDHDRDRGDLSTTTSRLKKKRDVRVWPKVPSCDGPYRSFGNWSGTVPFP